MAGRPSDYSEAITAEICARIALGESLRKICQSDDMPASSTIFLWLQQHGEFSERYARAREAQADYLAEEILEIADDGSRDYGERDGVPIVDHDHIQRSKLRVDARKWYTSKVAPKKYGDRVTQEHTGPDGGPITTKSSLDMSGLSLDQLKALSSIKVE